MSTNHLATFSFVFPYSDKYSFPFYVKNVYAVTPEDVRATTEKYIRDKDMTLVIVGDKKKVEDQIKDYVTPKPEKQ